MSDNGDGWRLVLPQSPALYWANREAASMDVRAMRECHRMVVTYTRPLSMTLRANVELFL